MAAIEKSKGMEILKSLDRVLIRETSDSSAKYVVVSAEGVVLLHAKEDSGLLDQMLAGKSRAFEIDIFDTDDKELYSADKRRIGCIGRVYRRAGRERELFELHFPRTLDVRFKAAVIGTCFLINAIYW